MTAKVKITVVYEAEVFSANSIGPELLESVILPRNIKSMTTEVTSETIFKYLTS